MSPVLMQVQVPLVDNFICRDLHKRAGANHTNVNKIVNEHSICAGMEAGKGSFKGDSGGPLMLPIFENGTFPFYQIGIISCSIGCAPKFVPSVFTKVQYYADWIEEKLRKYSK